MTKKISEVLTCAADLLSAPGAWTQGQYAYAENHAQADPLSEEACSWCALGAVRKCGVFDSDFSDPALFLLTDVRNQGFKSVAQWNDSSERTQDEVVAVLKQAAQTAREQGQ